MLERSEAVGPPAPGRMASIWTDESRMRMLLLMARPKEFDRDAAVDAAIGVFAEHGYEGTSTEMLLAAMKIGRQSMYDTFGDKRALFLTALGRYNTASIAELVGSLTGASGAPAAIEHALVRFAQRPGGKGKSACLGVLSICELGRSDADVAALNDAAGQALRSAIERVVVDGKRAGTVAKEVEPRAAADLVGVVLAGMKVSARNGASVATLEKIARTAVRALH